MFENLLKVILHFVCVCPPEPGRLQERVRRRGHRFAAEAAASERRPTDQQCGGTACLQEPHH